MTLIHRLFLDFYDLEEGTILYPVEEPAMSTVLELLESGVHIQNILREYCMPLSVAKYAQTKWSRTAVLCRPDWLKYHIWEYECAEDMLRLLKSNQSVQSFLE